MVTEGQARPPAGPAVVEAGGCRHHAGTIGFILSEFKRLRLTDETIYLRDASVNLVNGVIGMTFACDGAPYIDHRTFVERLDTFATPPCDPAGHAG